MSLLELLAVIVILVILFALVFAAMGGMQTKGNVVRSLNNLKQLYIANTSYYTDNGELER